METTASNNELRVRVDHKQILSIALPITLAILIPQLNLLVNSIFLGHLSSEALGNAGITGVFYLCFAVAGHGLNSAVQSVCSRYAGSNQPDFFKVVLAQGIRFAFLLATVFIAFTWLIAPSILAAVAEPTALPQEMSFLRIRILGLPFLYLFQLGNAILIATLNSRLLIIGFVFEAVFNVLFDYLLIFGHYGFPAMGFEGAALASVIAEAVGMIVVFLVLFFSGLQKKYDLLSTFRFNKPVNAEVMRVSIPLILQFLISLSTWLIFYLLIESKGPMAKAVSNTMRNVFGLAGVFIWAFAGTSNTIVSNLIGQGKQRLVLLAVRKISAWSFGLCLLIVLFLNITPQSFFQLFGQGNDFTTTGIPVIRMVSVGMLLMSVSNIWLNAVTGTGKTRINLAIEIVAIGLYLMYTYYFMKINYISLAMAWSNELVYWSTILVFALWFMLSGKWKNR